MTLVNRRPLAERHDQYRQLCHEVDSIEESREDEARVYRHPRDLRVMLRQLVGVEDLCKLALAVAVPFGHHFYHAQLGLV